LAELMAYDAYDRDESCGAHFREEYQTEEGEALRDDKNFAYVAAWEWDDSGEHIMHKELLKFEFVELKTRSYK
jgi:succinate dehydrogenase / fumarate reductase flavoprotein subunit